MPESGAYCGDYICSFDIDNWPSGSTYDDWKAIIDKVEQIIDKVCHTHFGPETFDIEINGNNKNRLFVPLKQDIITVTAVYVHCVELSMSWIDWDTSSIYIHPCPADSDGLSPELIYALGITATKGLFPFGYNNIRIVGTKGEAGTVPEAIIQAAVVLAKYENDPTLFSSSEYKSEKIGDYSYTKTDTITEAQWLTGVKEADFYLKFYIKRKPILMAP